MYKIEKMDQKTALEIADEWKYPGIYSFYDMTEDIIFTTINHKQHAVRSEFMRICH